MNSIKEASREERLERALLVLEGLTFLQDDFDENPFVSTVYTVAHGATARCCNTFGTKKIEELEALLQEKKVMDVEKVLGRPIQK